MTFAVLVLARIIEPTSKADTVRVLEEIMRRRRIVNTLHTALKRSRQRGYRDLLARPARVLWPG